MSPSLRRIFRLLNKYWMVPLFRLGLGPWIVNPFTGYIMVMITIGRRSGQRRYAPVNYAILKGAVYCVSGGRTQSDWYRNLLATPEVDVIMPGGTVRGMPRSPSSTKSNRKAVMERASSTANGVAPPR